MRILIQILLALIFTSDVVAQITPDQLDSLLTQKYQFHFPNFTLENALKSIGNRTGIQFNFQAALLAGKSGDMRNRYISLEKALNRLLLPGQLTFVPENNGRVSIQPVQERSSIQGVIKNARTNEPIQSGDVYLKGSHLGCSTDATGNYRIREIPQGIYELEVRIIGFQKRRIHLNLEGGKNIYRDILLTPDVIQMQAITTTAPKERLILQPKISAFKLRASQLAMLPGHGEKDIFRTLQLLPGVVMTNDFKSQLYIRGGNSDQNLVLMDGGTIYNPFHFSGILSAFDVDAIRCVEFYGGGFSAEYGGRLSSVLAIETRSGKNEFSGHFDLSPLSVKLLLEGPVKKWANYLVTVRRSYISNVAQTLGDRVVPDFYDGIVRLDIRPTQKDTIGISAIYGKDVVRLNKRGNEELHSSEKISVALNYHRWLVDKIRIQFNSHYGKFKSQFPPPVQVEQPQTNHLINQGGDLRLHYAKDSAFQLKAGVEYHKVGIRYRSFDPVLAELFIDRMLEDKAIYFTSRFRFLRWIVESGVRWTSFDYGRPFQAEPRLSVQYQMYNFLTFKAAWGRFRQNLVTIYNENDTYNPVDIWLPPENYMKPARADHFIMGLIYNTPSLNFSTEVYHKDYLHLTHYNRERLYREDPYFVQGQGYSAGLDFSVQWLHDNWQVWCSYALGLARKELPVQYPEPAIEKFAPRYDRRHSLNLAADYRFTDNLRISTRFTLGSGMPFAFMTGAYQRWSNFVVNLPSDYPMHHPDERLYYLTAIQSRRDAFRYPWYHRLDISVNYSFSKLRLQWQPYLQIVNLYNQSNVLYYDIEAEPHFSVPFLPMMGLKVIF